MTEVLTIPLFSADDPAIQAFLNGDLDAQAAASQATPTTLEAIEPTAPYIGRDPLAGVQWGTSSDEITDALNADDALGVVEEQEEGGWEDESDPWKPDGDLDDMPF